MEEICQLNRQLSALKHKKEGLNRGVSSLNDRVEEESEKWQTSEAVADAELMDLGSDDPDDILKSLRTKLKTVENKPREYKIDAERRIEASREECDEYRRKLKAIRSPPTPPSGDTSEQNVPFPAKLNTLGPIAETSTTMVAPKRPSYASAVSNPSMRSRQETTPEQERIRTVQQSLCNLMELVRALGEKRVSPPATRGKAKTRYFGGVRRVDVIRARDTLRRLLSEPYALMSMEFFGQSIMEVCVEEEYANELSERVEKMGYT